MSTSPSSPDLNPNKHLWDVQTSPIRGGLHFKCTGFKGSAANTLVPGARAHLQVGKSVTRQIRGVSEAGGQSMPGLV